MAKPIVTRESLQKLLDNPNPQFVARVVGKALVVLFNNQTADEKSANTTNKDNGIGFTGADAMRGSLTAKSFMAHNNLLDWQVAIWTKKNNKGFSRLTKYHKQLNEAAKVKT
jgi:hypothetical protein